MSEPAEAAAPTSEPADTGAPAGEEASAGADAGAPVDSRNASGRALASNAVSSYVMLFAGAFVGFICTPLLLHSLGETRFGVYSLLLAGAAYLGLLELGFGTATITRVANAEHMSLEAVSEVLSTSVIIFELVAAVVALLIALIALLLPEIFHLPASLRHAGQIGFLSVGAAQAVNSGLGAWSGFLIGTGRMYVVNLGGGIISIVVSIATVVVAELHGSLFLLGAVQLCGALATLYVYRRSVRAALATVKPSRRRASRAMARAMFGLGWRNSISSVMQLIAYGSDLVLVGILLAPRAVAAYAIALRGYAFMQNFANGALGAFGPVHAHQAGLEDPEEGFELFATSLVITLFLALLIALPVLVFAPGLLSLWLGRVPAGSVDVVRIFAGVLVLQCFGGSASVMMMHYERPGQVMRVTTLSAVVNVVASIVLTKTVGVTGPALGTITAVVLVDLFYFPHLAARLVGHGVHDLLLRAARPLLAPALIFAALLWAASRLSSHGLIILPMIIVAVLVFLALGWFTPMAGRIRLRLASH